MSPPEWFDIYDEQKRMNAASSESKHGSATRPQLSASVAVRLREELREEKRRARFG